VYPALDRERHGERPSACEDGPRLTRPAAFAEATVALRPSGWRRRFPPLESGSVSSLGRPGAHGARAFCSFHAKRVISFPLRRDFRKAHCVCHAAHDLQLRSSSARRAHPFPQDARPLVRPCSVARSPAMRRAYPKKLAALWSAMLGTRDRRSLPLPVFGDLSFVWQVAVVGHTHTPIAACGQASV